MSPTRSWLGPMNQRRWANFRRNRRGYWSLWIFLFLFVGSLFAEFIANDRPLIASYKGDLLFPVFVNYPEEMFGGFQHAGMLDRRNDDLPTGQAFLAVAASGLRNTENGEVIGFGTA